MDLIDQVTELSGEIGAMLAELDEKCKRLEALMQQLAAERRSQHLDVVANSDDADDADDADGGIAESGVTSDAGKDNAADNINDDTATAAGTMNAASTTGRMCISDIRRVLTLNDKFRFKRELFGNNEQRFAEALQVINSLETEQDLDAYIATEIAPGNQPETVEEFAEIIKRNISNKA